MSTTAFGKRRLMETNFRQFIDIIDGKHLLFDQSFLYDWNITNSDILMYIWFVNSSYIYKNNCRKQKQTKKMLTWKMCITYPVKWIWAEMNSIVIQSTKCLSSCKKIVRIWIPNLFLLSSSMPCCCLAHRTLSLMDENFWLVFFAYQCI